MWYAYISLLSHEFSIVPSTKQTKGPASNEGKLHGLCIKITQILGSSYDNSLKQFSSISEAVTANNCIRL